MRRQRKVLENKYEFEEPEEGDVIIVDNPRGGYEAAEIGGRVFAVGNDRDALYDNIRKWMKKNGWYPNVWFQDDHGGIEIININESKENSSMRRLSERKTYEFTVPEWAISALVNGDYTGLSNKEEKMLDQFLRDLPGRQGHWSMDDDEAYFSRTNDVDGMSGNVLDVTYVVMKESTKVTEAAFGKKEIDVVLNGYLEAVLYTEIDEDEEYLDRNYDVSDFSRGAVTAARRDVEKFLKEVERAIPGFVESLPSSSRGFESSLTAIGTDLLLTRNGHGAGFWDGDWGEEGDILTEIAERMGEVYAYADNGAVYLD